MKKIQAVLLIFCSFWLLSCDDTDKGQDYLSRTVLVYMAADNSLNLYSRENLQLMMEGMRRSDGNLVVYLDPANGVPALLQIAYEGGKAVEKEICTYAEENSASAEVLSRVIADTRRLFPADSYGLILWSHGLGWLPVDHDFPGSYRLRMAGEVPPTKYFAQDQSLTGEHGGGMTVDELASALPHDFSFILFDACFMSAVEVLYALRDHAEYIIASPAEVIANGFPYDKIVPYVWGGEEDYKCICREYYAYYKAHPNGGAWQSATVALVKTAGLEKLAAEVHQVLGGRWEAVAGISPGAVRRYPLIASVPNVFFDLGEYMRLLGTEEQYAAFKKQADATVIYKAATPYFNNTELPAEEYSGISSYIPLERWSRMNGYYSGLEWAQAVY